MSLETQDVIKAVKTYPVRFICGALVVGLGLALYFRSGDITQLETSLEQKTQEGTRQQRNIANATLLGEHLQAVQQANEQIAARTITPGALADNLQYFYQLEASLGVKLIDLRQGTPAATKGDRAYLSVPYTIALDGTYTQVMRFLERLENGNLYVRFVQMTVTPQRDRSRGGSDAEPLLTLSMNIEVLGRS